MSDLTGKQRAFIDAWFACRFNGIEAAQQAGYRGDYDTLCVTASNNLRKPRVKEEIERRWISEGMERVALEYKRGRSNSTCVYLIREGWNGLIKIGRAKDVAKRLSGLQNACPQELVIVGLIATDSADELECRLHKRFANKRQRGEWFALSGEDVESVLAEYANGNGRK